MAKYVTRTIDETEVFYTVDGVEKNESLFGNFNLKNYMSVLNKAYPESEICIEKIIPSKPKKFRMLEVDFIWNAEKVEE